MALITKAVGVAVGAMVLTLGMATSAGADPGDDPCEGAPLAVSFLCKRLPIASGLDHDIDFTQDPNGLNSAMNPEAPPAPEAPLGDAIPVGEPVDP